MIKIELGDEKSFEVTFKGSQYILREPTVAEVEQFKDQSEDGIQTVTKFLVTIGMPEDVIKAMPMTKAKILIDSLMEELGKKK